MPKLTEMSRIAGLNAGAEVMARTARPQDIKVHDELSGIFTIEEALFDSIVRSMKESGYDKSQPIVIWKGRDYVVDGHTRLKAALEAGIAEIPVTDKEFESLEDAIQYSYQRQARRRNLTQAEIFQAAIRLDIKDRRDGNGRGAELLAADLGVSAGTIKHARTVASRGAAEDIEAVKNGEMSINRAYQRVRQPKMPEPPGGNAGDGGTEAPPDGNGTPRADGPPGDESAAGGPGRESPDTGGGFPDPLSGGCVEEEGYGDPGTEASPGGNGTPRADGPPGDESAAGGPGRESPDMGGGFPDPGIKFLRSAVTLLGEKAEYTAIELLINHFLRKKKRGLFLETLPADLREKIGREMPYQAEGGRHGD